MKLYSYFRSSAAYRVRIALNFKGLAYETVPVHLVKDGGHNRRPEFRAVNPQMRIPALVTPTGDVLIQSLAIIEYLEETQPIRRCCRKIRSRGPRFARSPTSSPAISIRSTIVGTLRYLKREMHQEQSAIDAWYHHWVIEGFEAIEALVSPDPTPAGLR